MIAHFQIHKKRSSNCVTNKHTKQLDWPFRNTRSRHTSKSLAVPERDTVLQLMTGGGDSIFHNRNEREVGLEDVETLDEDLSTDCVSTVGHSVQIMIKP